MNLLAGSLGFLNHKVFCPDQIKFKDNTDIKKGINKLMEDYNSINKRTIALFDILGFKALVKKYPIDKLAKKYKLLIGQTEGLNRPLIKDKDIPSLFPNHPKNRPWCIKYIFSDTIILISENSGGVGCLKLLVYGWRLSQLCIVNKMPLRGGIFYGDIYIDPHKDIVLGRGLIDAYELEKKQNWIGVAIDESVEKAFPDLFKIINDPSSVFNPLFLKYEVPFKDGSSKRLHTLNWRLNLVVEKGTRSLFDKKTDKSINEKIFNTLKYAKKVIASGQVYDDREDLPVELRTFFRGSKKNMPFKHGDDL